METIEVKTEYDPDVGPTAVSFEIINIPEPPKKISSWSHCETKQMLDQYKILINEIGPNKRFMRKKDMWEEISLQFPTKSSKQCEERFKTVLRRKRKNIPDKRLNFLDLGDSDESCKTVNDDISSFKHVHVWSNSETRHLMELYKRFICEVGPQKRFVHKKDMWSKVSSYFFNKDPKQCEQRYNTVLKRKKRVTSSRKRKKTIDCKQRGSKETAINIVPSIYKNEISDNMEVEELSTQLEEVLQSSQNNNDRITVMNKEHTLQDSNQTVTDMKLIEQDSSELSIRKTLLEIATHKEAAKERRHKEKMEALNKMLNLLEKLLDSKNNLEI